MAIESMRKAYATDEFRQLMEFREKADRDNISRMKHAIKQAEAEGEARGKAEGKAEAAKQIARQLLALGQTEEVIFQATGLRIADLD